MQNTEWLDVSRVKHLRNVEITVPHMFLSLDFQCNDDVSGLIDFSGCCCMFDRQHQAIAVRGADLGFYQSLLVCKKLYWYTT